MQLYAGWHSETIIVKDIHTFWFPYSAIVSIMAETEMDQMIKRLTGAYWVNIDMISH